MVNSMKPYGLLGKKLSHSISPQIHNLLCDYEYVLFEKEIEQLDSFFEKKEFAALNVTIPYKKAVIKYCDELSQTAQKIGSVNTITIRPDATLYGDNTDYFGFSYMIEKSEIKIKNQTILVLGTGGAALSVKAVLEDQGAGEIIFVSRAGKVNYNNIYDFAGADVIVNTTPVGMYPKNGERLLDLTRFKNLKGVLDLIYNPSLTPLLYDAKELGIAHMNGLPMLVAQACLSAEKFINKPLPKEKIEQVIEKIEKSRQNIVLIGMPGCGKSTVARHLCKLFSREVADTDAMIEKQTGKTIPEIFDTMGEEAFRQAETKAVKKCGSESSLIIATGGGAVLKAENRYFLKQNGIIVWLKRDSSKLPSCGRPLSKNRDAIEKLEKERLPVYKAFADLEIDVEETPDKTAARILEEL